jgi:ubiquinone/menaquinone biosynthesis C-methylase UbiE
MKIPELTIPRDIPEDRTPSLLVNWHFGSKARQYMSRRRFLSVAEALDPAPGGRVLDIGCGWGYNLFLLGSNGFDPIGIDIVSNDFLAARRIADASGTVVLLAQADAGRLPFRDETFDAVTSVETFEHIFEHDRIKTVREIFRILRPGGILSMSTPNFTSLVESGKRLLMRVPSLKRLFPPMCYPVKDTDRDAYHPYSYHLPVRRRELVDLLLASGFEEIETRAIIFVWKNLPDLLFYPALWIEAALERLPGSKRLGSTLVVKARKRR